VWVCGCVGVWVCGCVGVWVCGCVGVWVCGVCGGVWVGEGGRRFAGGVLLRAGPRAGFRMVCCVCGPVFVRLWVRAQLLYKMQDPVAFRDELNRMGLHAKFYRGELMRCAPRVSAEGGCSGVPATWVGAALGGLCVVPPVLLRVKACA
jgi:hypothetical protein